jgi:hypothetical protein
VKGVEILTGALVSNRGEADDLRTAWVYQPDALFSKLLNAQDYIVVCRMTYHGSISGQEEYLWH